MARGIPAQGTRHRTRKRGDLQDTVVLTLHVPARLAAILDAYAAHSIFGVTAEEIAVYMLKATTTDHVAKGWAKL